MENEKEQTSEKASGIFIVSMILLVSLFYLLLGMVSTASAQPAEYKMSRPEYIEKYRDDAIKEMLMNGIPASIVLAQGMLESDNGNSALATYANNHFGIKCHKEWGGPIFIHDDDEKDECFRKYPTVLDSYSDHSFFLKSRTRYAFLFDLPATDYRSWAYGLKNSGYATDPRYAEKLIRIIEENKLHQYDIVSTLKNIPAKPHSIKPAVLTAAGGKSKSRTINIVNGRKCIIISSGDSYTDVAHDFDIELWDIFKYNDADKESPLKAGEKVFIEPKRRKGAEEFHVVKYGDSIHSISQEYGIRLKWLYKRNHLKRGSEPAIGVKLRLR